MYNNWSGQWNVGGGGGGGYRAQNNQQPTPQQNQGIRPEIMNPQQGIQLQMQQPNIQNLMGGMMGYGMQPSVMGAGLTSNLYEFNANAYANPSNVTMNYGMNTGMNTSLGLLNQFSQQQTPFNQQQAYPAFQQSVSNCVGYQTTGYSTNSTTNIKPPLPPGPPPEDTPTVTGLRQPLFNNDDPEQQRLLIGAAHAATFQPEFKNSTITDVKSNVADETKVESSVPQTNLFRNDEDLKVDSEIEKIVKIVFPQTQKFEDINSQATSEKDLNTAISLKENIVSSMNFNPTSENVSKPSYHDNLKKQPEKNTLILDETEIVKNLADLRKNSVREEDSILMIKPLDKPEEVKPVESKPAEPKHVSTKAVSIALEVGDGSCENYDRDTLKAFDRKFRDWEKQFENWKNGNKNHPDRNAYSKYMNQWDLWRRQLVEQRRFIIDSMNKSRLAKADDQMSPSTTNSKTRFSGNQSNESDSTGNNRENFKSQSMGQRESSDSFNNRHSFNSSEYNANRDSSNRDSVVSKNINKLDSGSTRDLLKPNYRSNNESFSARELHKFDTSGFNPDSTGKQQYRRDSFEREPYKANCNEGEQYRSNPSGRETSKSDTKGREPYKADSIGREPFKEDSLGREYKSDSTERQSFRSESTGREYSEPDNLFGRRNNHGPGNNDKKTDHPSDSAGHEETFKTKSRFSAAEESSRLQKRGPPPPPLFSTEKKVDTGTPAGTAPGGPASDHRFTERRNKDEDRVQRLGISQNIGKDGSRDSDSKPPILSLFSSPVSLEQAFPFFDNNAPRADSSASNSDDRNRLSEDIKGSSAAKDGFKEDSSLHNDRKVPNPPPFIREKSPPTTFMGYRNQDQNSLPPSQRPIEKIARDPLGAGSSNEHDRMGRDQMQKRPSSHNTETDSRFEKDRRLEKPSVENSAKSDKNDQNPFGLPPPKRDNRNSFNTFGAPQGDRNPFNISANQNQMRSQNPFEVDSRSNLFSMPNPSLNQSRNPFDLNRSNVQDRNPFDISIHQERKPFEIVPPQRNPYDSNRPTQGVNAFNIPKMQSFEDENPFGVALKMQTQQKNPFDISNNAMPNIPFDSLNQRKVVDSVNPFMASRNVPDRNPFDIQQNVDNRNNQLLPRGDPLVDSYSKNDKRAEAPYHQFNDETNDDVDDLSKYYTRERPSSTDDVIDTPKDDEDLEADVIDYGHGGIDDLDLPRGELLFSRSLDEEEEPNCIEDDLPTNAVTIDYGHGASGNIPHPPEGNEEYYEEYNGDEEYYDGSQDYYPPPFRGRGFPPFARGRGGPRGRFPFYQGDPNHPMNFMRPRFPGPGYGPPGFYRGRMPGFGMRPELNRGFRGRPPMRGGRGGMVPESGDRRALPGENSPIRRAALPLPDSEIVELSPSVRDKDPSIKIAPPNPDFDRSDRDRGDRDRTERFPRNLERSSSRDRDRERSREQDIDRSRERDRDRSRERERARLRDRERERDRKYPREISPRRVRDSDQRRGRRDDSPYGQRDRDREGRSRERRGRNTSPARSPVFDRLAVYKNAINPSAAPRLGSLSSNPPPPRYQIVLIEDILNSPGRNKRPHQLVIILRGLPGSGKTHAAKLIKDREVEMGGGSAPRILSIDDYFMTEVEKHSKDPLTGQEIKSNVMEYEYEADLEPKYRLDLLKTFKKTVENGYFQFIIVDAVNEITKHYEEMATFATQKRFQVYIAELEGNVVDCAAKNIHNRSKEEIEKIHKYWEKTPPHLVKLDIRTLLQDEAVQDVEMEDVSDTENIEEESSRLKEEKLLRKEVPVVDLFVDSADEDEDKTQASYFTSSKWEKLEPSEEKLNKLDGLRKKRKAEDEDFDGSKQSLEKWLLGHLPEDYSTRRQTHPGEKRVRWADIEERREQERMRDIGFVLGQTDWNRMTDPTFGSSALTRTKFI